MRGIGFGFGLGLAGGGGSVGIATPAPTYTTMPNYATFAVLSDSFGEGRNATNESTEGYVPVLASQLGATQLNRSISGSVLQNSPDASGNPRANNGRDRYATSANGITSVGGNKRAAAILALGFNDARYIGAPATFNAANYENDLTEIVNGLLADGYAASTIYVCTPWYITDFGLTQFGTDPNFSGQSRAGFEAYVAAAERVARARQVNFINIYDYLRLETTFATTGLSSDGYHPNTAGHAMIATGLRTRVQSFVAPDVTQPTITSASAFNQAENGAFSTTLTANEPVSWSKVGGADQALFTIAGSTLSMAAKDYEAPTDADANNTYIVTVRATDGAGNFSDQTITVTITDVAEGGGQTVTGQTASYSATANGTLLENTVATLGAWIKKATGALVVRLGAIAGSASASTTSLYVLDDEPLANGQFAEADMTIRSNTAGVLAIGPMLCYVDNSNHIAATYNGQNIRIQRVTGGTIGNLATGSALTAGTTPKIRFEVKPDGTATVYLNGSSTPDCQATNIFVTSGTPNNLASGTGMGLRAQTASGGGFTDTTGPAVTALIVGKLP